MKSKAKNIRSRVKNFWVYPKSNLGQLESCSTFYGTKAAYSKWLKEDVHRVKDVSDVIQNSAKFSREI